MRLRPLNNEIGLEVWKSPKTNFLGMEIMLMYKVNLYMMTTSCLYAIHTAALNVWDRIEDVGKKIESFTEIRQGPKETFMISYKD